MSDPTAPSAPTTSVDILNSLLILREGLRRAVTSPALVAFASQLQAIADRIDEILDNNREVFELALRNARNEDSKPSSDLPSPGGSGRYRN